MLNHKADLLSEVADYYTCKLAEHGESPQGVDWNSVDSQTVRFKQLCKIIDTTNFFSINDLGCGYGALYDFLTRKNESLSYLGIDVSEAMIKAAKERFKERLEAHFVHSSEPNRLADFGVASGIFNVRMDRSNDEWELYLKATLDVLNRTSRAGFAFNCLTTYSDKDKMRDDLYYADPCLMFDLCKRRYSKNIVLLHDYDLYEFTILVRKRS